MRDTDQIAVVGVGLGLVAVALAAGLGFVARHDPPQEFWTLASGLAGGLLGLLAPTPATRAAAKAHKAVAAKAATAAKGATGPQTALAFAATADAQAVGAGLSSRTALGVLIVLFLVCETFLLFYHPPFFTADVGKQLQALASAAAGAAIGLLAPSPTKKSRG